MVRVNLSNSLPQLSLLAMQFQFKSVPAEQVIAGLLEVRAVLQNVPALIAIIAQRARVLIGAGARPMPGLPADVADIA